MKLFRIFILAILCGSYFTSMGQAALSPYSTLGVGDPKYASLAHNDGMGGLGLSKSYTYWLNYINPALLPQNSFTVFEFGMFGDYRNYEQGENTGQSGGLNLGYLATAFPIIENKMSFSIGLNPYSSVHYSYFTTGEIEGTTDEVILAEEGEGGINQLNLSVGYNLIGNFNALFAEWLKQVQQHGFNLVVYAESLEDRKADGQ